MKGNRRQTGKFCRAAVSVFALSAFKKEFNGKERSDSRRRERKEGNREREKEKKSGAFVLLCGQHRKKTEAAAKNSLNRSLRARRILRETKIKSRRERRETQI